MNWKNLVKNVRSGLFREDPVCPWWLAYAFDNPLRRFLHDPDVLLAPYIRQGMTVADIGCGMGYFSLAMAKLTGEKGLVISVDIQQEMLDIVRKRAGKRGIADRIRLVKAAKDDIGVREPVDFVLTFWMVHETGDIRRFLRQVASVLKKEGIVFISEPRLHVSRRKFEETLEYAREAGFTVMQAPKVRISRSAALVKK